MSTTYEGNPAGVQSPATVPMPGTFPKQTIPADGEGATVASIAQALKVNADYVAYLMQPGRRAIFSPGFEGVYSTISSTAPLPGEPKWTAYTVGGGSQITVQDIGAVVLPGLYGGLMAQMIGGGVANRYAGIVGLRGIWVKNMTGCQVCFEQDIAVDVLNDGRYDFGLTDSTAGIPGANSISCLLDHDGLGGTSWWLHTTAAGYVAIPSSAATASTTQRFKMIISGSTTPAGVANGNTPLIRVWIDDVLKLTQSGALTSAGGTAPFYPFISSTATSGAGSSGLFGAPVISLNRY